MLKQMILPLAVLAMLASILVPLPAPALDVLLVGNLLLSLLLLTSTLYLTDPLKLSTLPTVLLLATMLRLALNISTTRLILGAGDAGRVVEAFGAVVIQGNLAVGIVVFAVITLVQFLVIAKGSERVAEVSARFTLDAMPGKQMSIDADMRAGLIDLDTARQKRQELQIESRFYGALDGAMKFVKGDAIAGIVIVVINLAGGLIIGTVSGGLSLAEAAAKYCILTVGDGLLAQIPALMCSLAAGMVVTRVVSAGEEGLGSEVLRQIGQVRAAKLLIGVLALALAFAPGLPWWPFVIFSAFLLAAGAADITKRSNKSRAASDSAFQPRVPALLEIKVSREMYAELISCRELVNEIDRWRLAIYERSGMILMRPEITRISHEGERCKVYIRGIPFEAPPRGKQEGAANQALPEMIAQLDAAVRSQGAEFIDDIMTRRIIDFYERTAPELVSIVVPQIISLTQLTSLFKLLYKENISIRQLDLILQSIAESGAKAGNARLILQEVRIAMRRVVCSTLRGSSGAFNALALDPLIDIAIASSEQSGRTVDATLCDQIVTALAAYEESDVVLVCSRHSRLALREALISRKCGIRVAAHDELSDASPVNWMATISAADEEARENAFEMLAA